MNVKIKPIVTGYVTEQWVEDEKQQWNASKQPYYKQCRGMAPQTQKRNPPSAFEHRHTH